MADRWRRYVRPELAPWCQPDGANDPYEYVLERFKNGGRRNLLRLCLAHDAMYIMAAELRRCSRDRRQEFMERLISHDAMHRAAARGNRGKFLRRLMLRKITEVEKLTVGMCESGQLFHTPIVSKQCVALPSDEPREF